MALLFLLLLLELTSGQEIRVKYDFSSAEGARQELQLKGTVGQSAEILY